MKTHMAAFTLAHMFDLGQFPYTTWLKATLIFSGLYDIELIYLFSYM